MNRAACLAFAFALSLSTHVVGQDQQSDSSRIKARLADIFVSIDFTSVDIDKAVKFLSDQSKQLDPEHKGINIFVTPTAASSAKSVTVKLDNLPLKEALRYVCLLAGVRYKVEASAVAIVHDGGGLVILKRTFYVPPNFVAPPASSTVPNLPNL